MLLTGERIDAAAAARWGLINKVVHSADLMHEAFAYANKIAANALLATQTVKELAHRSKDVDIRTGLRLEQMMLRTLQASEDSKEGVRAFAEKRAPRFAGR